VAADPARARTGPGQRGVARESGASLRGPGSPHAAGGRCSRERGPRVRRACPLRPGARARRRLRPARGLCAGGRQPQDPSGRARARRRWRSPERLRRFEAGVRALAATADCALLVLPAPRGRSLAGFCAGGVSDAIVVAGPEAGCERRLLGTMRSLLSVADIDTFRFFSRVRTRNAPVGCIQGSPQAARGNWAPERPTLEACTMFRRSSAWCAWCAAAACRAATARATRPWRPFLEE